MTSTPGLARLTRRRFATPRSAAAVIVVLTLVTAFAVAAAPRALVGVVRDEVAHEISSLPAAVRDLSATMVLPSTYGSPAGAPSSHSWDDDASEVFGAIADRLSEVRAGFEPALQDVTREADLVVSSTALSATPAVLPADAPNAYLQLAADPAMQRGLRLDRGRWPADWSGSGPVEVALSAESAARMQWPVGQRRDLAGQFVLAAGADLSVVVVGLVSAVDPDAERWAHLPTGALAATLFDDGNRRPDATGVGFVATGGWPAVAHSLRTGQVHTTAWYPVDAEAATRIDPTELARGLRQATIDSVAMDEGGAARLRFSSTVQDILEAALSRAGAATAILAVAAVGPIVVALALTVLACRLVIGRRRSDLALLWARGASIGRLRRLVAVEGGVLGVPAAGIGVAAAAKVAPFDAGAMPSGVALAIGIVPGLVLAATVTERALASAGSGAARRAVSRWRRVLEGIVMLVAAMAVTLLLVPGAGGPSDAVDPLVVMAPLLLTVALALVVVRLQPLPVAAVLRSSRRGRGVVTPVGAARALRASTTGPTAVLAMLVAAAIAVFSSVVLATVDTGAERAAQQRVGADVQVSGPFVTPDQLDAVRAVPGVAEASGVLVGERVGVAGVSGRTVVTVVAAETARLADVQHDLEDGFESFPPADAEDPIDVAAARDVVDAVGAAPETERNGLRFVQTVDRLPGVPLSGGFVVVDVDDHRALTGLGFFPRTVLIDLAVDADAEGVLAAVSGIIAGPHTVDVLEERTAAIRSSPVISALRAVLVVALVASVALSVVAMLLAAAVGRDARSRTLALLRTMGLSPRQARGIVLWEFAPSGLTAAAGGVLLGALLPILVIAAVDLRPFTGGAVQPALEIDPVLTGSLLVVVALALTLAVAGGVLAARSVSIPTVLRNEEDR